MPREKTIEKYMKIKKMLKSGATIRQIKTTLKCSDDTIYKAKNYVPIVPKKIRTSYPNPNRTKLKLEDMEYNVLNKKRTIKDKIRTFDPSIAAKMIVIFMSYGSQYGKIQDDGSFRYKVRMQNFEEVEDYLTKFTQIEFNYVKTKRLEDLLAKTNKEIAEYNGGN